MAALVTFNLLHLIYCIQLIPVFNRLCLYINLIYWFNTDWFMRVAFWIKTSSKNLQLYQWWKTFSSFDKIMLVGHLIKLNLDTEKMLFFISFELSHSSKSSQWEVLTNKTYRIFVLDKICHRVSLFVREFLGQNCLSRLAAFLIIV